MMIKKEINIELYNYTFFVCIVEKENEIKEIYDSFEYDSSKENLNIQGSVCSSTNKKFATMIIYKNQLTAQLLVHEIIHLVSDICKRCDLYPDRDRDEHIAYLTDHIFEKICRVLKIKEIKTY
ncbi:MAG: hypothetical protein ACRC0V_05205 [Fusobacteriaceae bacterium]